jgi:hypothetical protein
MLKIRNSLASGSELGVRYAVNTAACLELVEIIEKLLVHFLSHLIKFKDIKTYL